MNDVDIVIPRVLRLSVDIVVPLIAAFALYLLLVGHDEPGGGFAAGLVVAGALSIHELAHGGDALRILGRQLPSARGMLGAGIALAAGVAVAPLLFGDVLLSSTFWKLDLGLLGKPKISTVLAFDIGVFLVVVGFARTILDHVTEGVVTGPTDAEEAAAASGDPAVRPVLSATPPHRTNGSRP